MICLLACGFSWFFQRHLCGQIIRWRLQLLKTRCDGVLYVQQRYSMCVCWLVHMCHSSSVQRHPESSVCMFLSKKFKCANLRMTYNLTITQLSACPNALFPHKSLIDWHGIEPGHSWQDSSHWLRRGTVHGRYKLVIKQVVWEWYWHRWWEILDRLYVLMYDMMKVAPNIRILIMMCEKVWCLFWSTLL